MPSVIENTSESSGLSLAVRLQQDSTKAWHDLVELYGPLVVAWARRTGLDNAAAEDIAQEVFLSVHRSIDQFDPTLPNATFRGWLWRITRNAVLQSMRKPYLEARGGSTANARLAEIPDPLTQELSEDEPPSTPDDTTALVERAMRQIESLVEPTTWQAFLRTTVGGESSTDVAKSLGLTSAAVRKAKSRTLQRLRKQLGDMV